jgi:predicted transcriptional regulator
MKNIQEEVQKIHAQYGITEKANYQIQLLCEEYAKKYFNDKIDQLSLRLIGIQCFAEDNYTNAAYKAVARAFEDIKQWIKVNRVPLG